VTFRFVAQHLNHCATAVPEILIRIIHNPQETAGIFVQQLAGLARSPWATNCLCFVFLLKSREATGYENTYLIPHSKTLRYSVLALLLHGVGLLYFC